MSATEIYAIPASDVENNITGRMDWQFCSPGSTATPKSPTGKGNSVRFQFGQAVNQSTSTRSLDHLETMSMTTMRSGRGNGKPVDDKEKAKHNKGMVKQPLMNEHTDAHHANPKAARLEMVKDVEDLNMAYRDPANMNSHVRVGFEEVFAEPDGQQSFDAIWTTSFIVYTQSKVWCYRLLSATLAIPLALLWGIQFALLTFCHIWWVSPCIRAWLVIFHWVGRMWAICVRTLCDPINDSCSRLLGNVKVQMHPAPMHHV